MQIENQNAFSFQLFPFRQKKLAAVVCTLCLFANGIRASDLPRVVISISEPDIAAQAPEFLDRGAAGWGRWQFPRIRRMTEGRLALFFSTGADSVDSSRQDASFLYSADNGETWQPGDRALYGEEREGLLLPNGDRLRSGGGGAIPVSAAEWELPESVCDYVDSYRFPCSLYRLSDLPASVAGWRLLRMPYGEDQWFPETADVYIPGELRRVIDEQARGATPGVGNTGTVRHGFLDIGRFRQDRMGVAPDGYLWAATVTRRLINGIPRTTVVFLRSDDVGKSWYARGEIPYRGNESVDPHADKRNGFTEPVLHYMPDGTIFCLLRTMDGHGHGPLYSVRSTDDGKTWSKPKAFDKFGKSPQLLTLDNGVTLASYGASGGPGYFAVRATADPAARVWEEALNIAVSPVQNNSWDTCGHTEMVALDENRILLVYSDFNYPDEEGNPRKTILTRRITVSVNGNGR